MRTKRIAPLSLLFLLVGLSAQAASLPIWSRTFVASRDGKSYTVQGVGGNPFYNGARTTTIPITIVPLVFTFADGTAYDPTEPDPCSANLSPIDAVLQSPIFQPTPVSIDGVYLGQGQLLDEFQRANFYARTCPLGQISCRFTAYRCRPGGDFGACRSKSDLAVRRMHCARCDGLGGGVSDPGASD